jgi:phosphoglucosamine mutase
MKYFGTDGIRATFGSTFLTEDFAFSLGKALASFMVKNQVKNKLVLIARDTRPSGEILVEALNGGLASKGFTGVSAGVVPTPALAFGTIYKKMAMGIMITASHNPAQDNGFKIFSSHGLKLSDQEEEEIEKMINPDRQGTKLTTPESLCLTDPYLKHLAKYFPDDLLRGKKIVVDLSNGATKETTSKLLQTLGADVFVFNNGNGQINDNVGSEHPSMIASKVTELKADFGIAHDGDGDRVIFCNSFGEVIPGDKILGLLAVHEQEYKRLLNNNFVATIHSNSGLDMSLKQQGIVLHRADVGDRKVAEMMRNKKSNLGGESSGHLIASDFLPTGDGLLTALLVARASYESGKSIDSLSDKITLWPSVEGAFRVNKKIPIQECESLRSNLSKAKARLGKDGRVLLRYSGTEPKIRLLVEASEQSQAQEVFDCLVKTIEKTL